MADDITSTKNLSELMGAPIIAIVEGEALAARTSANFIKDIGFENSDPSKPNDFGKLRMVTFRFSKTQPDGTTAPTEINVPLLAIIPIPMIQVKNATLDFSVQITGFDSAPATPVSSKNILLQKNLPMMKGIIARNQGTTGSSTDQRQSFSMKVSIQLEQAGLTSGMQSILQIMQQSLTDKNL